MPLSIRASAGVLERNAMRHQLRLWNSGVFNKAIKQNKDIKKKEGGAPKKEKAEEQQRKLRLQPSPTPTSKTSSRQSI